MLEGFLLKRSDALYILLTNTQVRHMMNNLNRFIHSQSFRYLFAGGLTTLVNFILFTILIYMAVDYRISNTAAFILASTFAYFINEGFVFRVTKSSNGIRMKRGIQFLSLRMASYAADMTLMIILVGVMSYHALFSKIFVNIVVIILNYIISKLYIFKEVKP